MPRDHFAQMIHSKSHRHDVPYDSEAFDKDFGTICGMLYSVITLKCFFPSAPAPEMNNYPVKDAEGGESKYTQLTLF
jgi:hypothetical protein